MVLQLIGFYFYLLIVLAITLDQEYGVTLEIIFETAVQFILNALVWMFQANLSSLVWMFEAISNTFASMLKMAGLTLEILIWMAILIFKILFWILFTMP